MEANVRLKGLNEAVLALRRAFPSDPKKKQRLLHSAMGASARKTILPVAKQLAMAGDGSGSLSAALKVRVMSKAKRKGGAGMELVPVRHDTGSIYDYIHHYYTSRGKTPPADIVASGIRHGHLVEFGSVHNTAKPFLWPAAKSQGRAYTKRFAAVLEKRIKSAVNRAARKAKRAKR